MNTCIFSCVKCWLLWYNIFISRTVLSFESFENCIRPRQSIKTEGRWFVSVCSETPVVVYQENEKRFYTREEFRSSQYKAGCCDCNHLHWQNKTKSPWQNMSIWKLLLIMLKPLVTTNSRIFLHFYSVGQNQNCMSFITKLRRLFIQVLKAFSKCETSAMKSWVFFSCLDSRPLWFE